MTPASTNSPSLSLIVHATDSVNFDFLCRMAEVLSSSQVACREVVILGSSSILSSEDFVSGLQKTREAGPGLGSIHTAQTLEEALSHCSGRLFAFLEGVCSAITAKVFSNAIMAARVPGVVSVVPGYATNPRSPVGNILSGYCYSPLYFVRPDSLPAPLTQKVGSLETDHSSVLQNLLIQLESDNELLLMAGEAASYDPVVGDSSVEAEWIHALGQRLIFGQITQDGQGRLNDVIKRLAADDFPDRAQFPMKTNRRDDREGPVLSVVVIGYAMPTQLERSLTSLSPSYQSNIRAEDYEVVVVENNSAAELPSEFIQGMPENFHYYRREEPGKSPAAAINFGLSRTRGNVIGLMIDGAHMLTPGVLNLAILASGFSDRFFVTVPTYHLGPEEQNVSTQQGYCKEQEEALLTDIRWPDNGYRLFDISSLCGANPRGYFAPIMESNCYFATREMFDAVGGADERYQQAGGGSLNLDIVRKLGTLPGSDYFALPGEGSFHQFHGGVTSNSSRAEYARLFKEELHERWDQRYRFLERNPILLGALSAPAFKNLEFSSDRMLKRFENFKDRLHQVWADDTE